MADNHRVPHDAQYIVDGAERMKTYWGPQKKDDNRVYKVLTGRTLTEVSEPESQAGQTPVRPLRTGKAGIANARNSAVLSSPPTNRVNPIVPGDVDSRQHADNLEVFYAADWWLSQVGEVYHGQVKDLDWAGRGWSNKFPLPRLWAGSEYRDMAEEYQKLTAERADASPEDAKAIDKERKRLDRRMDDYLAEHYPIRWRKMSVRSTWPQWSDEIYLPEVWEIRQMTDAQIESEYGLPRMGNETSTTEVYVYYNHEWTQTVVAREEPQIVREWEHGLGIQPCSLMEINVIDDEPGRRWRSPYLDYIEMLETEDEMMSDLRHSSRRNALAGPLFKINVRDRGIEDEVRPGGGGIGAAIEYRPGEPVFLRTDEDYGLAPAPGLSADNIRLLDYVTTHNNELLLNPTERGQSNPGESAIGYATALQTAQSRLDPYSIAIEKGVRHLAKVTSRSAIRIMAEFPDAMDKLAIVAPRGQHKGKGVTISASDLEGWETQVQPRISITLPVNRNAEMALATSALNLTLPPDYILETWLNVENAEDLIERWIDWQVFTALMGNVVQQTQQYGGMLAQEGGEQNLQQFAQLIGDLPAEDQLVLSQALGGQVNGQSNANLRQAGVLQGGLSQTQSQEVMPGG